MQQGPDQAPKGDTAYGLPLTRRDVLGLIVSLGGVVLLGLLAFSGSDISQSVAGIIQLLIGAMVFVLVLAYVYGVLLLEAIDSRLAARLTSDVMLVVIPATVAVSAVLSLIRG